MKICLFFIFRAINFLPIYSPAIFFKVAHKLRIVGGEGSRMLQDTLAPAERTARDEELEKHLTSQEPHADDMETKEMKLMHIKCGIKYWQLLVVSG